MVATLNFTPVEDGYTRDWGMDSIIMQPMAGSARVRRFTFNNPHKVKFTWMLSYADFIDFEAFYYTTLKGGSLQFNLTLLGAVKTCRFLSPLQTGAVKGDMHVISAQVEILR